MIIIDELNFARDDERFQIFLSDLFPYENKVFLGLLRKKCFFLHRFPGGIVKLIVIR